MSTVTKFLLMLVIVIGVIAIINRRIEKVKNAWILTELHRLTSIAGPNDIIYISKLIDFNIAGYTLYGNGCTIDFTHPEMAGPDGIRLVQSGVINLEDATGVIIKNCTFEAPKEIDPNSTIIIQEDGSIRWINENWRP